MLSSNNFLGQHALGHCTRLKYISVVFNIIVPIYQREKTGKFSSCCFDFTEEVTFLFMKIVK